MINEIVASKGINGIERDIYALYTSNHSNVNAVYTILSTGNWYKTYEINICHKIPISSFLKALAKCMNYQLQNTSTTLTQSPWAELSKLYDTVDSSNISSHNSQIVTLHAAVKGNNPNLACTTAWQIATAFDASHANLYFGYASTNSSISDNCDFHFDLTSSSQAPTPPTPRGPSMQNNLNAFEQVLSLPQTTQIIETDTTGTWVMNSGVYGKQTAGTGYVLTK